MRAKKEYEWEDKVTRQVIYKFTTPSDSFKTAVGFFSMTFINIDTGCIEQKEL
jgi:hypothetical protein